jgi:hypothetical protein
VNPILVRWIVSIDLSTGEAMFGTISVTLGDIPAIITLKDESY